MLSKISKESKIENYLPIFLNMEEKDILIVGGGELAFELVLYILENSPNSNVTIVTEKLNDKIEELKDVCENLSSSKKSFEKSDLDKQEIVFITIKDHILTKEISTEAKNRGVLVNAPLLPELNDFDVKFNEYYDKPTDIHRYSEDKWKRIAFTSIGLFFVLIIGYVVSLFISFDELKIGMQTLGNDIDDRFYWMILVGFIAQLIDGLLGMGYGLSATAALLSVGIPLPAISGSIHTAEMFSSGVSGFSHYKFGNVNKKLLRLLIIPGVIGAVSGAMLLSKLGEEYADYIKPMLAVYTLLLGVRILYRVFRKKNKKPKKLKRVGWLAFSGGFLDSFGGGGWGPLVTSTLISKGKTPRFVIGTVSLAEFFITLSSALTFFAFLGLSHWPAILGLIIGGMLAAPIAARLAGKLPMKIMFTCVGVLVILWSIRILVKTLI